MKKLITISLLFPLCIIAIIGYVQVLSKDVEFPLEVSKGDESLLDGVQLETTLSTLSSISPRIHIIGGKSRVSYVEGDEAVYYQLPPLSQREVLYLETPVLDESKKELLTNSYFHYQSNGDSCEVYSYPQNEAKLKLEVDASWDRKTNLNKMLNKTIETGLMVYPQEDYKIEAIVADCPTEDIQETSDIRSNYSFESASIEQASNQDYYTMPIIHPNMDGTASIYRFHETLTEKNISQSPYSEVEWEEKNRYDFPVTKGMYGILKVVNDTIYVWTWKENVLTLQIFDEELNLIREQKEDMPLSSMILENPKINQNDEYLIFGLQNHKLVYQLESGELVQHYDMDSLLKGSDSYTINDIFYKNDKLYLSGNETTQESYDFNPLILVYDDREEIYRAKLRISNYTTMDLNNQPNSQYVQRDFLMFVR